MQTLSVLSVEEGAILVASPAGERFRLPVDAALRSRLTAAASTGGERRLSPREIQAHVRSGLTAAQVAAMTGAPVADVERFVGPVLAERAYIVESALAVRLPPETEGARSRTFGAVMGERLDALAARNVQWTSAKEPSGWVLAVAFVADDVEHHARWRFDPKHMRLEPDNVEASTLSQQGVPAALTPRLRAIEPTAPVTIVPRPAPAVPAMAPPQPDRTRFDSAVFHLPPVAEEHPRRSGRPAAATDGRQGGRDAPDADPDALPVTRALEVVDVPRSGEVFAPRPVADRVPPSPITPFPARPVPRPDGEETEVRVRAAEPMRRRRDRGRPSAVPQPLPTEPTAQPQPSAPASSTARPASEDGEEDLPAERQPPARPRRGRTSMPSWDEIVFGRDEPS